MMGASLSDTVQLTTELQPRSMRLGSRVRVSNMRHQRANPLPWGTTPISLRTRDLAILNPRPLRVPRPRQAPRRASLMPSLAMFSMRRPHTTLPTPQPQLHITRLRGHRRRQRLRTGALSIPIQPSSIRRSQWAAPDSRHTYDTTPSP